jgi:hypothetical protein
VSGGSHTRTGARSGYRELGRGGIRGSEEPELRRRKGDGVTQDVGKLEPLFEEGQIGTMRLRDRFVQSLLFTQYATTWDEASDRLIKYHRARALRVARGRRARDDRGAYRRGAARPARENSRGKEGGGRMRSFIHDALPGRVVFVRGLLEDTYTSRRPGLVAERRS